MSAKGLTLVETVAALALLGALAIACLATVQIVTDSISPRFASARWELCADETMSRLHADLWSLDFTDGRAPAPVIEPGEWRLPGRRARDGTDRRRSFASGDVSYRFDAGAITRVAGGGLDAAPLLAEVAAWRAAIRDRTLEVHLTSVRGQEVRRWFPLP